jgi:RimJ/RimL family protein N-acetyltransferase
MGARRGTAGAIRAFIFINAHPSAGRASRPAASPRSPSATCMADQTSLGHSLADRLPDVPRWVEARDLLRGGRCEILGLHEEPELSFVVRDTGPLGEIIVVGAPADDAILAAATRSTGGSLAAPLNQAERIARLLPAWDATRAVLHLLGDAPRLPEVAPGQVRFLEPGELARLDLPGELAEELADTAQGSPIAAALAGGRPVAFCYAGAITETLWDISIDTLPEHRRRGYAALCVTHLIHHMHARGKQPVWASVIGNPASWMLARKLGFVPVDEIALFDPPEDDAG